MSFDKIFDLTAGVYFHFYDLRGVCFLTQHVFGSAPLFAQMIVRTFFFFRLFFFFFFPVLFATGPTDITVYRDYRTNHCVLSGRLYSSGRLNRCTFGVFFPCRTYLCRTPADTGESWMLLLS